MDLLKGTCFFLQKLCVVALLVGCNAHQVESSAQRNAREEAARSSTPAAKALLDNRWCGFVDSTQAPVGSGPAIRGFLRLSFFANEEMNLERYAEAAGKPFGKADDDKKSLWKLEGNTLHIRTSETDIKEFQLSFGELKNVPTMDMKEKGTDLATFWICNKSIDEDPIPVEITPEAPPEDAPPPPPEDEN